MGASVVVGALCVSHSDLAKDKNRYVVKIILHLKRSLGPPERAFAYHRQHLGKAFKPVGCFAEVCSAFQIKEKFSWHIK